MVLKKSTVLPAPKEAVLDRLMETAALRYIARPLLTFEAVDGAPPRWTPGGTSRWRLRLFGLVPLGVHTITPVRADADGVGSREGNRLVPVWNHDIRLRALDGSRTEYTDRVEIRAGWKTPVVRLWAGIFYAHRQRRRVRLLKAEGR